MSCSDFASCAVLIFDAPAEVTDEARGTEMTKRPRPTGLKLKGRSFGQHPKDGPVKHIRVRRRRAKRPETETGSDKPERPEQGTHLE